METLGFTGSIEPEPVLVNVENLIDSFQSSYQQFAPFWKGLFSKACYAEIHQAASLGAADFKLPVESWVHILYELAATFYRWRINRYKLIDVTTPLYYARVASFVRQSRDMTSMEAEALVEEQAGIFEERKDYLRALWNAPPIGQEG
ncbi:hypothetical protein [Desulfosoma sp.]|uniref:hypothetical protein n=1 Tax=Desulfosoma sp. TaxID=2603217 RepID=UPI00404B1278